MAMKLLLLLSLAHAPLSNGFRALLTPSSTRTPFQKNNSYKPSFSQFDLSRSSSDKNEENRMQTEFSASKSFANLFPSDFSFESISERSAPKIMENVMEGDIGSRGEIYFVAQALLVLCILFGGVPIPVIGYFGFVAGPALILLGIGTLAAGLVGLGDESLSPWPVPLENTALKTSGIFGKIRHPLYAGLLSAMLGVSLLSDSAPRVLLTGALYYVLSAKVEFEEEQMIKSFPDYKSYTEQVKGKFVPDEISSPVSAFFASLFSAKDSK